MFSGFDEVHMYMPWTLYFEIAIKNQQLVFRVVLEVSQEYGLLRLLIHVDDA